MGKYIDLTGQRFGRLVCVKDAGRTKKGQVLWFCRCDCGENTIVISASLISGATKSCGCLRIETSRNNLTTHGLSRGKNGKERLYEIWIGMKKRCLNKKDYAYKYYGERGIIVCKEWLEYEVFHEWAMANGYQNNLTIERVNNNGNYEPSNCTWIPQSEQGKNKSNNHFISYKGTRKTITAWSKVIGINDSTLHYRLKAWGVEKALNTPKGGNKDAAETINA